MIPLKTFFKIASYDYQQLERHEDLAIFSQTHRENIKVVRYEVVIIREEEDKVWANGKITPAHEKYPGSAEWGMYGWTFFALDAAREKMRALQAARHEDHGKVGATV